MPIQKLIHPTKNKVAMRMYIISFLKQIYQFIENKIDKNDG